METACVAPLCEPIEFNGIMFVVKLQCCAQCEIHVLQKTQKKSGKKNKKTSHVIFFSPHAHVAVSEFRLVLSPPGRHVKQRGEMSGPAGEEDAEQSSTFAIMPHAAGPSVCVRAREREREKEQRSLLSQASHYVPCNLSFRGPGPSSNCAEWGWSNWPPLSFLCFHSAQLGNSDYKPTVSLGRFGGRGVEEPQARWCW